MTTHRLLEPISFVSWINSPNIAGPLHICRPRSQKGIAYCNEPIPIRLRGVAEEQLREFTIEHPDVIPLEIRVERDFARLCRKCARTFFSEVVGENPRLRWTGDPTVPIVWQVIYGYIVVSVADAQAEATALAERSRKRVERGSSV